MTRFPMLAIGVERRTRLDRDGDGAEIALPYALGRTHRQGDLAKGRVRPQGGIMRRLHVGASDRTGVGNDIHAEINLIRVAMDSRQPSDAALA